ncbi:MAG: hypothetical protein V1766_12590 [Pseudomonadota bacterium]
MTFFYLHAAPMSIGFLLLAAGAGIAKFQRQQRWWLSAHKTAGRMGAAAMLAGLVAAFLMVGRLDSGHIRVPHAGIGLVMILSASMALILGPLQFKIKDRARHIREKHRWSGRITLIVGLTAILSGLRAADII